MARLLCPSVYSVDFNLLQQSIQALDAADSDIFHVDIMDGHFVQNLALSPQDLRVVRDNTKKRVDVHLMIENPGRYIDLFVDCGADILYVHPESEVHIARTLDRIRAHGKKAGIAINPGTSVATIQELLPLVDYIMIMGVNPGFAGQKFLDYITPKIDQLAALRERYGFQTLLDGGINFDSLDRLSQLDIDGFVVGHDLLHNQPASSYVEILDRVRHITG
ncbi:ribulose-phosphate 3-epimerase [Pantoea sp. LMR881]|uniref:ribulose-phosphate 3-epimerase n=1 Tax=Pantoea sp. LMR881 TaxID=3014336 RepID=UPI0022AF6239|nr:ribulose-phosphate 3-epimerase [Pantoea sp. LMR881]MCZ4061035.1 ribulose-phosphate 3-epimerase [Pantoea sp. LMR881]